MIKFFKLLENLFSSFHNILRSYFGKIKELRKVCVQLVEFLQLKKDFFKKPTLFIIWKFCSRNNFFVMITHFYGSIFSLSIHYKNLKFENPFLKNKSWSASWGKIKFFWKVLDNIWNSGEILEDLKNTFWESHCFLYGLPYNEKISRKTIHLNSRFLKDHSWEKKCWEGPFDELEWKANFSNIQVQG